MQVNIIIAIVNSYFREVHDEIQRIDKWKDPTPRLEQDLVARAGRWSAWIWRVWRLMQSLFLQHRRYVVMQGFKRHWCCCWSLRGRQRLENRELCWCELPKKFERRRKHSARMCLYRVRKCLRLSTSSHGVSNRSLDLDIEEQERQEEDERQAAAFAQMGDREKEETLQFQQWDSEARFFKILRKCSQLAKRVHDLKRTLATDNVLAILTCLVTCSVFASGAHV
jgi:hypothetical protein